jgi:hypothetical protein
MLGFSEGEGGAGRFLEADEEPVLPLPLPLPPAAEAAACWASCINFALGMNAGDETDKGADGVDLVAEGMAQINVARV